MKNYLNFDIAFYTIAILVSLAIAIVSCGDGPHKKRKGEWKKHHIEHKPTKSREWNALIKLGEKQYKMQMDSDTIHSDSLKQVRRKLWKKRIKQRKDCKK